MSEEEFEYYGDPGIRSADAKVPKWLILTYTILPFWGLFALWFYWNGSVGWLDRGYWYQLQKAANTTFPAVNYMNPEVLQELKEEEKK